MNKKKFQKLNVPLNNNKEFHYNLADEKNLVLTDYVFNCLIFKQKMKKILVNNLINNMINLHGII